MKITNACLLYLALAFTASGASAQVAASESGYTQVSSKQAFVLNEGTAAYNEWKQWINQRHDIRKAKSTDGSEKLDFDIGQITIVTSSSQPESKFANNLAVAMSTDGPPTPLPVTGTPGQRISIINNTQTVYEKWVYEWRANGSAGVDGGWTEISYTFNSCDSIKAGQLLGLCPASAD